MKRHYAISAAIRYYKTPIRVEKRDGRILVEDQPGESQLVDFRRWKDAPHVAFANLLGDLDAVSKFTSTYGVVSARPVSGTRYVNSSDVIRLRDTLRQAWRGDDKALQAMMLNTQASLEVRSAGLEAAVSDLWTLIRLLFLQDHFAGRARICANPDCHTMPYFLVVRKGQKFCSDKCAVLISVRRLRERQAKQRDRATRGKRRRERDPHIT
jgi:hypothetical protein